MHSAAISQVFKLHFVLTFLVEIGDIKNLEILSVWDNQFVGEIPRWIAGLTKLRGISMDLNQFTGEIPPDLFDNLVDLTYLYLNDNKL
jgi:Leucine-rich repeat (LRR) protein